MKTMTDNPSDTDGQSKGLFVHYFCTGQGLSAHSLRVTGPGKSRLAFDFSWLILCPHWKQKKPCNMM